MFIASSIVYVINFFYQIIISRILGSSGYCELIILILLIFISGSIMETFKISITKFVSTYNMQKNNYKLKNFFKKNN